VAAALYVWGVGRALGADVYLRIEDHDRGRCRPEYEAAIFTDLAWLGLSHDNRRLQPGTLSPYRQSDQLQTYADAIERLAVQGRVYACDCSRQRIAAAGAAEDDELRYDGHCRDRRLPLDQPGAGLRFRVEDIEVSFDDLALGPQKQRPARQCGDMLLRDRHGNYTYQLAVAVDDYLQGMNLIIRGQDLTPSTGRQILLARSLGRQRDALFLHHPLIKGPDDRKLGKRFWSEAIGARRERGEGVTTILGEAAHLVGLTPAAAPLAPAELPALLRERFAARLFKETVKGPGGNP
jgi:glutamyl-tRNA synthetase/glutamyl-Q tRNA(Asp) synthetase